MSEEEKIGLLNHQIHEMDQDINNYLEQLDRYREALRFYAHAKSSELLEDGGKIAQEELY